MSSIEWTGKTWVPTVGCTKISRGCDNCYAQTMHNRLTSMGLEKYADGFGVVKPWPQNLNDPLKWKKPRRVFVNSMSDVFHKNIDLGYIQQIFDVMHRCPHHTFQVLTKRSRRLARVAHEIEWPENVWMGVSVEDADTMDRIDHLRSVPAHVRFLSLEPLLGPLPGLNLDGMDWVIAGGESGRGARPMEIGWVRDIRDRCLEEEVAFFFKQWGNYDEHGVRHRSKSGAGRLFDGREWNEYPDVVRLNVEEVA